MSDTQRRQLTRNFCIVLLVCLPVLLRLAWLDSDGYAGLTWNSELVTDEAFYCHDARNLMLTGSIYVAGDNFHNALIMPLLHLVQIGVFRVFGFSLVASRLISVTCSFLTLPVFYAACRRAFGNRVALIALALLGFDHINLLYNRMALMDTPAQLFLVACFYVFVRAFPANTSTHGNPAGWMACCGLLLMAAYAIRGLSALLLPVLLFLVWRGQHSRVTKNSGDIPTAPLSLLRSLLCGLITGLALGLIAYICAWYLPNRAALQTVNHFYVAQQLMPHSLEEIRHNIGHSLFGNERGFTAYLFRHSPVQWTLALAWLLGWPLLRLRYGAAEDGSAQHSLQAIRFLMLWMGIMLTAFALVRYSPPRYYVLFYPAMAALAALALAHIQEVAHTIGALRVQRSFLGTLLIYHLLEAVLRHRGLVADVLLYGLTLGVGLLLWHLPVRLLSNLPEHPRDQPITQHPVPGGVTTQAVSSSAGRLAAGLSNQRFIHRILSRSNLLPTSLMLLWAVINCAWLLDWAGHIQYTQRDCDQWLQRNLPASAVLIGDAAPGLTLRSHITPINVIPGLCNDVRPLEAFTNRPCYIIVFESPTPLRWWKTHYPQFITPEHCMRRFVLFGKFRLALYQAQQPQVQPR